MPLTASLERGMAYDRRRHFRHTTNIGAGLSANIRPSTAVTVTDLTVAGCGIRTEWELEPGARAGSGFRVSRAHPPGRLERGNAGRLVLRPAFHQRSSHGSRACRRAPPPSGRYMRKEPEVILERPFPLQLE